MSNGLPEDAGDDVVRVSLRSEKSPTNLWLCIILGMVNVSMLLIAVLVAIAFQDPKPKIVQLLPAPPFPKETWAAGYNAGWRAAQGTHCPCPAPKPKPSKPPKTKSCADGCTRAIAGHDDRGLGRRERCPPDGPSSTRCPNCLRQQGGDKVGEKRHRLLQPGKNDPCFEARLHAVSKLCSVSYQQPRCASGNCGSQADRVRLRPLARMNNAVKAFFSPPPPRRPRQSR